MKAFAQILNETEQLLKMSADLDALYFDGIVAKDPKKISVPATEQKGEQKLPVAKPNGVTR
jgi:hypothetical protein